MDETKLKVSMYSKDQVQFETNTKLVEANCKQAWMKPNSNLVQFKSNMECHFTSFMYETRWKQACVRIIKFKFCLNQSNYGSTWHFIHGGN
jgi:hypothetical protein